jgi:hypothetical protein
MSISAIQRKKRIAERIMQIDQVKALDELEELLVGIEMRARVEASMHDIDNGNVMTLEEFHRSNREWLKAKRTE